MSGKDNVGTSGGVAIDKIDRSGYGDCSSFDTLNVAIRWPRTPPPYPKPAMPAPLYTRQLFAAFELLERCVQLLRLERACANGDRL